MPRKPDSNFGFVLQDVARLLRRSFNRRVQDLGLTQAQWQILAYLSRHEGIRQAKLADMLDMQPISVTRLVDRMESAGWIERRPDPADRRAVNLHLRDKAGPILEQMWERGAQTRQLAMKGISAEKQKEFLEILQQMRINLIKENSESEQ
jgi:DNA-binding MarR family transcriptional regulator